METTNIQEFIIAAIDRLAAEFPAASFTYGYDGEYDQHLVEVQPNALYKSSGYTIAEGRECFEFIRLYSGNELLFISDSDFLKVENPLYRKGPAALQHAADGMSVICKESFSPADGQGGCIMTPEYYNTLALAA